MSNSTSREILRSLAHQVADIAGLPVQGERSRQWRSQNSLRPGRPLVLAFNEDLGGLSWPLSVGHERCDDELLRGWEKALRLRIFEHERLRDDHPVTATFDVGWVVRPSNPEAEPTLTRDENAGFDSWSHPLEDSAVFARLRPRRWEIDRELTARNTAIAEELFGDILHVRTTAGPAWRGQGYATLGGLWWSDGLCDRLARLRGTENVMLDMYERPEFLHQVMAFLRDDMICTLDTYEAAGILTLNNRPDDYIGSGAMGATDELPGTGFDGQVRLEHLWGLGESQDFTGVGPRQWREFVLEYELPIINRFGLVSYGCCEPLDDRYDILMATIPRLRRLSVTSPYADVRTAAERLGNRYILSWKPNPSWLSPLAFDEEHIRRATQETVRIATEHDCRLEIVMKGFRADYELLARWTEITSRVVAALS